MIKKVIFFDDFSTDNAFWKKSDHEKIKTEINNGKFVLDRKIKGGIFFKNDIDQDP